MVNEAVDGVIEGELLPVIEAAAASNWPSSRSEPGTSPGIPERPRPGGAYQSDVAHFRTWCAEQRPPVESLPATPATVALYLTALTTSWH